jgi:hypothetical protein
MAARTWILSSRERKEREIESRALEATDGHRPDAVVCKAWPVSPPAACGPWSGMTQVGDRDRRGRASGADYCVSVHKVLCTVLRTEGHAENAVRGLGKAMGDRHCVLLRAAVLYVPHCGTDSSVVSGAGRAGHRKPGNATQISSSLMRLARGWGPASVCERGAQISLAKGLAGSTTRPGCCR